MLKALFLIYLDRNLFLEGASVALDSSVRWKWLLLWVDGWKVLTVATVAARYPTKTKTETE